MGICERIKARVQALTAQVALRKKLRDESTSSVLTGPETETPSPIASETSVSYLSATSQIDDMEVLVGLQKCAERRELRDRWGPAMRSTLERIVRDGTLVLEGDQLKLVHDETKSDDSKKNQGVAIEHPEGKKSEIEDEEEQDIEIEDEEDHDVEFECEEEHDVEIEDEEQREVEVEYEVQHVESEGQGEQGDIGSEDEQYVAIEPSDEDSMATYNFKITPSCAVLTTS